jgi:hypothetical protein
MKNNIIAIVAISFTVVGTMWAVSNLISSNDTIKTLKNAGIILVAKDNLFNSTNPDIHAKTNIPLRITIVNKDFTKHDFIIDELNVNTGYYPAIKILLLLLLVTILEFINITVPFIPLQCTVES